MNTAYREAVRAILIVLADQSKYERIGRNKLVQEVQTFSVTKRLSYTPNEVEGLIVDTQHRQ